MMVHCMYLTVGSVGLRKGMPYILEVAQRLKGQAKFRVVGSIDITSEARYLLEKQVELVGQGTKK